MSERGRLALHMMLPADEDFSPGETDAFDAQLERQLARLEGISTREVDLDDWEDNEEEEDVDDFLRGMPRGSRFS